MNSILRKYVSLIGKEQVSDNIVYLLSQNEGGGFASYELYRSYSWLEVSSKFRLSYTYRIAFHTVVNVGFTYSNLYTLVYNITYFLCPVSESF
jgi:hypothetical protein